MTLQAVQLAYHTKVSGGAPEGLMRREGIRLAGAVMVVDVCVNWWGNRHWLRDDPGQLLGLLPLTLFGVFVIASWLPLRRAVADALTGPSPERNAVAS